MSEELHPVTKLLLARMQSHPEEFRDGYAGTEDYLVRPMSSEYRWAGVLDEINRCASDEDKQAIGVGLRGIRMAQAHEWVMDELLNGPARREEEKQRKEVQEKMYQTTQASLYAQASTPITSLFGSSDPYGQQDYSSQRSTLGGIWKKGLGF